jgi:hypothetical protein
MTNVDGTPVVPDVVPLVVAAPVDAVPVVEALVVVPVVVPEVVPVPLEVEPDVLVPLELVLVPPPPLLHAATRESERSEERIENLESIVIGGQPSMSLQWDEPNPGRL